MQAENLIPKIDKKIERKLKELKLKPRISPKEFIRKTKGTKHRFVSVCEDKDKNLMVFYARLHQNPDAKKKIRKEVLFCQKLKNRDFQKKLAFQKLVPQYFDGKIEKDFEWFKREYISKNPLGENERLIKKINKKAIAKIAFSLYQISKTPLFLFKEIPLKKFSVKNYIYRNKDLDWLVQKKLIDKNCAKTLAQFGRKNYPLLKKENKYFSHGDFNLGNLIKTKKGLKIIDWESMQINNFAFDVAYFFTHLWDAPKWARKCLIKKYISFLKKKEKEKFKTLFKIAVIDLTIEGIEANPKGISGSRLKKRKRFFKNLLINSAKGFGKLINT